MKTTYSSVLKNDDVQTSSSQVIGAAKVFDAFGNELSSTGAWKSQFGYAGKFGYQSDSDSGLKLLGHRYYDSSTGKFLTRDPIKDGRNWYVYCDNSPISQIDPIGLDSYVWAGFSGGTVVQGQVVVTIGMDSNGDIILGFDIGGGWFAGVGGSIGGMGYRDDMEPGSTHEDAHGGSVSGQIGPIGAEFPITDKKGLDIGKGRYGIGNGLGFGLNYGRSWRWNISAYLRKVQRGIRDMLDYGRGILDEVVKGITSDIGKPVDWSPLRGVPNGRPF